MTRDKYFSVLERINVKKMQFERADCIRRIIEAYPHLKDMSLADVKDYLIDAAIDTEKCIEEELNVER